MRIADYTLISQDCHEDGSGFAGFRRHPEVAGLGWPDDVLEQWLYDHAGNEAFLLDYADVDLAQISWEVEAASTDLLVETPTGDSDGDCIDEFAANPDYWIEVRHTGIHRGVALCWEIHGTWKRWPVLIERSLLTPSAPGLQVVEGRTRIGILKGRHRQGDFVSAQHLVWVGRPRR
ncbi:hypothetical protein ED92_10950 [Amycolatopsis sp. MJM2582]|uniref:hypothetical protein n=1 Tax=Amycolatopsis sp. MJM2582 TaxID=1427749 RepID=UPI000504106A|nr:hypothetical protein [Amycolatopsis sp. MJM2582]KFZ80837.1 hypothetical protein ED92_10950 [Amycolatopsis sp. MJM2582]